MFSAGESEGGSASRVFHHYPISRASLLTLPDPQADSEMMMERTFNGLAASIV